MVRWFVHFIHKTKLKNEHPTGQASTVSHFVHIAWERVPERVRCCCCRCTAAAPPLRCPNRYRDPATSYRYRDDTDPGPSTVQNEIAPCGEDTEKPGMGFFRATGNSNCTSKNKVCGLYYPRTRTRLSLLLKYPLCTTHPCIICVMALTARRSSNTAFLCCNSYIF